MIRRLFYCINYILHSTGASMQVSLILVRTKAFLFLYFSSVVVDIGICLSSICSMETTVYYIVGVMTSFAFIDLELLAITAPISYPTVILRSDLSLPGPLLAFVVTAPVTLLITLVSAIWI